MSGQLLIWDETLDPPEQRGVLLAENKLEVANMRMYGINEKNLVETDQVETWSVGL